MNPRKLFGTDGIRGSADAPPLDDTTVRAIGRSLARVLAAGLGRAPRIVSGRDTRESGPRIEAALAAGIRDEGGAMDSAGVITTPGVACVTRLEGYDAGVVLSASHNPYRDNGIKIFSPTGKKLDDEAEAEIERLVPELTAPVSAGGLAPEPLEPDPRHAERYLDYLRSEAAAGLDLTNFTLAVDCAHGASYALAPRLFESLGATVHVIGAEPDGRNINEGCGSLHLEQLSAQVTAFGVDLGVAFDGDADRALFVDGSGVPVDGDAVMYALAVDMDARGQLNGRRVVATVMSNVGLEVALRERGLDMVRTAVGDKNVLDELLRSGASLGGEQSGHVIFPEISLAGDGMITALEVLGAMRRAGRPLAELVAGIQRYPQVLINVPVREKRPFESVPEIASAAAEVEQELAGSGRLLLRYSGTENLARVMIEGRDAGDIAAQAERIAAAIRAGLQ
jgi:phosphoglucosamine mutase